MYLKSLTLSNVKRFRSNHINFCNSRGIPRNWTVFLGENGTGKTTLLQAIALAASGPERANQLSNANRYLSRLEPNSPAKIDASFDVGHSDQAREFIDGGPYRPAGSTGGISYQLLSSLHVDEGAQTFYGKSFLAGQSGDAPPTLQHPTWVLQYIRSRNIPGFFATGYGVRRHLPEKETSSSLEDPSRQRIETLFDKGVMTGFGFNDLLPATGPDGFSQLLRSALLKVPDLVPHLAGIELRGRGGTFSAKTLSESDRFEMRLGGETVTIPATWLSQGYQGIIAWVADLLGHAALDAGKLVQPEEVRGVALIDELDLFLHPRWQVNLIRSLKRLFPNVQFIATTHSPLVLIGLSPDEIIRLNETGDGGIDCVKEPRAPELMTGSELYDVYFGIDKLFLSDVGNAINRYSYLAPNAYRSDEEEREMQSIRAFLESRDALPKWVPVPQQRRT